MDEDSYINKHRAEWQWLQTVCSKGGEGLARLDGATVDKVLRSYLRASSHLAEARGRFRDTRLEEYLNGVVRTAQVAIYSGVPRTQPGILKGFGTRYRDAIRSTGRFILIAVIAVLVTTLASWMWIGSSPEARAGLFPDQAQEFIARSGGDRAPDMEPSGSLASMLLIHNFQVAVLAFGLGITFGVGTSWVLIQNGLLLGSLAGAFSAAGKTSEFWSLIMPHGVLEITAICIAAGAGLRIGWALVSPGDASRADSLRSEASEAFLVVLGVLPAFALAALIEAFVTGTGIPNIVEIGLGVALSAGYLVFLFGPSAVKAWGRKQPVPALIPPATAVPRP